MWLDIRESWSQDWGPRLLLLVEDKHALSVPLKHSTEVAVRKIYKEQVE